MHRSHPRCLQLDLAEAGGTGQGRLCRLDLRRFLRVARMFLHGALVMGLPPVIVQYHPYLVDFSLINTIFWGTPIYRNPYIVINHDNEPVDGVQEPQFLDHDTSIRNVCH